MKKQIHIVHIITDLSFGGAQRFVVDLVNHADKHSYRFSIVTLRDDIRLAEQITTDVSVHVVEKKGKLSLGLFADLRKKLTELNPDIVHTHLFAPDIWGRVAARQVGLPIVTTEHNTNYADGAIRNWVKKQTTHHTSTHVAVSDAIRSYSMKHYGITDMQVIRPGIDLSQFLSVPALTKKKELRYLMLGRITKQKGFDIGLQAFARVQEKNWQLSIVGEGEDKQLLETLVARYQLQQQVTVLVPTADVAGLLSNHDVVVVPSRWEGLGVVIMEAFAAGRVVIGSAVGGIPELIQQQQTGLLVPAEDVDALHNMIQTTLEDPSLRSTLGAAARMYAKTHFGLEKMIGAYAQVYQSCLKKKAV